ncbi:hypothetical protein [Rugosimonospora africana]|uniref:Uncharacterized protein n=1 Tax=Rugosimonospora africana TaxID=556532 RepID=A0A8J3QRK9_9ACTN|nr:hypothetical protein [Rugosimonospora africana]GIH14527.1 hypothetical protein Raf01_26990 [Rugosimonospora africana]
MVLIFLLGIVVGSLAGWSTSQRMAGWRSSGGGDGATEEGFVAGLVAGFITLLKGAALIVAVFVVLFALATFIAPLPRK